VEEQSGLGQLPSDSVLETHPHYRTAVGVLGVALPPTLVGVWLLVASTVESSISAYYHTSTRDWFVGTLWVIAAGVSTVPSATSLGMAATAGGRTRRAAYSGRARRAYTARWG
jgi:ABC-type molybdate transport system permease subunit